MSQTINSPAAIAATRAPFEGAQCALMRGTLPASRERIACWEWTLYKCISPFFSAANSFPENGDICNDKYIKNN